MKIPARAILIGVALAAFLAAPAYALEARALDRFEDVEQALHDEIGESWGAAGFAAVVEVAVAHVRAEIEVAYAAEVAAQARARAELAAAARVVPRASTPSSSSSSSGSCGGATNGADAFIARESGGSSTVWNTTGSGAWGCYQIMPGTWSSSCSDLGAHGSASTSAQAACASRLPLSAWSSSGPT